MDSTNRSVRSSPKRTAELDRLIKSFQTAQGAGDRGAAIRLIDRAWRIAPKNPELNHLYGLILLSEGQLEQGIALLDSILADNAAPNIEAICISALCRGGMPDRARARLETALGCYAVAQDGELARAARSILTSMAPAYAGWIGIAPDLSIHGEVLSTENPIKVRVLADLSIIDEQIVTGGVSQPVERFSFPLHTLPADSRLTAVCEGGRFLGANLSLPTDFGFDGGVPAFKNGKLINFEKALSGWARLTWDTDRPLSLWVSADGGAPAPLPARLDPLNAGRHNFTLKLGKFPKTPKELIITAIMPDGTVRPLPGSPTLIDVPSPLPPEHRERKGTDTATPTVARGVDVVIPVYSGLTETLDCIRAVRKTTGADVNIIVIDDATPDPALMAALDALATIKAVTLLRNVSNLGFPESANRGMRLNPDRDVVILNADTEVFGDWLARLRIAAYSEPGIGTVTPLTNAGSIASYSLSGTSEPDSKTAAAIDRLAKDVNKSLTVEAPTGVGFCMFIRRDCFDEVGFFDSATFGRGYGEENDFCLRASKAGWRHILAADIYVRHVGGRSFGGRKNALYERNLRLLFLRYPNYHALTDAFSDRDPLHAARRRLDEARLPARAGRSALIVSLALDGGAQRAATERASSLRLAGLTPIVLKPVSAQKNRWMLSVPGDDFEDLHYELDGGLDDCLSLLAKLDFDHIELHHFLDLPASLVERLFGLSAPIDIYIHDYIWYCPRITLLGGDNRYCGEPLVAVCESCVSRNGSRLTEAISVSQLRARSLRWLGAARRRVVPTPSVATRMKAQFPQLTFEIVPLETPQFETRPITAVNGRRIKVALIGAIGDHKGYRRLLEMARHAASDDLPLDFVVIGHTQDDNALFETGRVFVTGEFKETEIESLIAREKPDLALFLSEFPETWCYALTHALQAGLPVAALDLGALADRLRNLSAAPKLFPLSSTADDLCRAIIAAFEDPARNHSVAGGHVVGNEASSRQGKHGIVANMPPPLDDREILRRNMATELDTLPASVNFVPLTRGLFLFSVKSTHLPVMVDQQSGLTFPAMQLSPAPACSTGQIEFISAPNTASAWLSAPHDRIVVRVSAATATMLLTSIVGSGMTPVEVEIQRLDADAPERSAGKTPLPTIPAQKSIEIKVAAHVQNRGDLEFAQLQWVGAPSDRLWIESFSITPVETLSAGDIEYQATTATGVETPWISNGGCCGTRGIGVPLTGFAVRLAATAPVQGVCEYGAILKSGTVIGPARDGTICRSDNAQDPIVGLWVSIDASSTGAARPSKAAGTKIQNPIKPASGANMPAGTAKPEAEKRDKGTVGPRFSIFRDPGKAK